MNKEDYIKEIANLQKLIIYYKNALEYEQTGQFISAIMGIKECLKRTEWLIEILEKELKEKINGK